MFRTGLYILPVLMATPIFAGPLPSPSAPPTAPLAVPAPNYVVQRLEITVERPAEQVWARIGRFCDMQEWIPRDCTISSGQEGEVGAVRRLPGGTIELIVAVTPMSYTYAFPVRVGVPYTMQHNTLQVQPVDKRRSRIVYLFMWDNSALSADQRKEEMIAREQRVMPMMQHMKAIVESGRPRPKA